MKSSFTHVYYHKQFTINHCIHICGVQYIRIGPSQASNSISWKWAPFKSTWSRIHRFEYFTIRFQYNIVKLSAEQILKHFWFHVVFIFWIHIMPPNVIFKRLFSMFTAAKFTHNPREIPCRHFLIMILHWFFMKAFRKNHTQVCSFFWKLCCALNVTSCPVFQCFIAEMSFLVLYNILTSFSIVSWQRWAFFITFTFWWHAFFISRPAPVL